jgi:hypothetical protein
MWLTQVAAACTRASEDKGTLLGVFAEYARRIASTAATSMTQGHLPECLQNSLIITPIALGLLATSVKVQYGTWMLVPSTLRKTLINRVETIREMDRSLRQKHVAAQLLDLSTLEDQPDTLASHLTFYACQQSGPMLQTVVNAMIGRALGAMRNWYTGVHDPYPDLGSTKSTLVDSLKAARGSRHLEQ